MDWTRRNALTLLPAGWLLSLSSSLLPASASAARRGGGPAALLVPLTGASAALGLSMRRAAALVQTDRAGGADLLVLDSGDSPEGAATAAREALRRGAKLILGPLFATQVRAVIAVADGRAPVLTFSNDSTLLESGAFVMGVTASQLVTAILGYARTRGVRRMALTAGADPWGREAEAVARALQPRLGIALTVLPTPPADAAALAASGDLPDALLLPGDTSAMLATARALRGSGVQLLAATVGVDRTPTALAALDGAWLATPDPAAFAGFAERYETRNGGAPGVIAALAYDGARIARALRDGGAMDRKALLALDGFSGATGALRFRADGSCARALTILTAGPHGYAVAEEYPAA